MENDRYCTTNELIARCDEVYRRTGRDHLELLAHFAALDDARVWRDDDCRDMAQWVAMSYGIPSFRARRMVAAGHALRDLPSIAAALQDGTLSVDKVLELCRFAAPDDERKLIRWAKRISVAAIRDKADLACRIAKDEVAAAERARTLEADPGLRLDQRRADALVTLASAAIADDADPDRATVVVHVPVRTLSHGDQNGVLEGGRVIAPEVARGLCCDSRMQFVFENEAGRPVHVGTTQRELPPRLSRILRRRDGDRCCFPGCGNRRFLKAHHIDWWGMERKTLLDKLLLVCPAHHDLIHKHYWNVRLKGGVEPQWFRPDGNLFVPGPSP